MATIKLSSELVQDILDYTLNIEEFVAGEFGGGEPDLPEFYYTLQDMLLIHKIIGNQKKTMSKKIGG